MERHHKKWKLWSDKLPDKMIRQSVQTAIMGSQVLKHTPNECHCKHTFGTPSSFKWMLYIQYYNTDHFILLILSDIIKLQPNFWLFPCWTEAWIDMWKTNVWKGYCDVNWLRCDIKIFKNGEFIITFLQSKRKRKTQFIHCPCLEKLSQAIISVSISLQRLYVFIAFPQTLLNEVRQVHPGSLWYCGI